MLKSFLSRNYISSIMSFFLFFAIRILFTSLISVFLLDQGYSAASISMISATTLAVSFFLVPIIGRYTDIYGGKKICSLLLFICSIAGIGFAFSHTLLLSGILYCVVMVCINTIHPIIEKQATQTSFSYGTVRVWGTIGNAIGTQLSGILYQYISPQSVYVVFSVASIITWIFIRKTFPTPNEEHLSAHESLLKNRWSSRFNHLFLFYLLVVFFFYAALDAKALYLTAFLRNTGFSVNTASTILFVASLFEIPVVLFGGKIIDKYNCKPVLIVCLSLLGFQLAVYSFTSVHCLIILITFFTNAVVSMSYIMLNMKIVYEIVDKEHQLSALTVTTGIRSLAAVTGQTVGGRLIDCFSYQIFYTFLFFLIIISVLIASIIQFPDNRSNSDLYR